MGAKFPQPPPSRPNKYDKAFESKELGSRPPAGQKPTPSPPPPPAPKKS